MSWRVRVRDTASGYRAAPLALTMKLSPTRNIFVCQDTLESSINPKYSPLSVRTRGQQLYNVLYHQ